MTDKDELDRYGAKEARDLIGLLKKLGPHRIDRAPSSFQRDVLKRLKAKEAPRKRFTWTPWYQVPLSAAAGLVLGIVLAPFFLTPVELGGNSDPLVIRGKPVELGQVDKQVPGEWLESIAELLVQGQVARAYLELGEFRRRYPDYEQTP